MIFSLKIRSELIGHCIYYTIQLSDIDLYRFFLVFFLLFFFFGFIFGINNDKL